MRRRAVLALLGDLALGPQRGWAQLGMPRSVAPRAFAPVTVLNMATRNAGTYTFAPQAVQIGIVGAILQLDVSQATDPLPSLTGALEGSLDGGTTWTPAGAFTRPSRPRGTDPSGAAVTSVATSVGGGPFWSASANANRQLRGSATLGGPMRFAMLVTPR